jgi:ribosomal protein S24E
MADLEWNRTTANRAEQIAKLARYATAEPPTLQELQQQHAQMKELYITVEHIQNIVFRYEGNHYMWTEAQAAKNFSSLLLRIPMPTRKLQEMDILLVKRKETIRDIVYHLTEVISKVSIEIERQKLIALAHISREIAFLMNMRQEMTQTRSHLLQQVTYQEQRTLNCNQHHDYQQRPLDLRTSAYN